MSHTDPPSHKASAGQAPPSHKASAGQAPPPHEATASQGLYDNPTVSHEPDETDVKALAVFTIGLLAVIAIVFAMMWGLFVALEREAAGNDPQVSPLARPSVRMPASTVGNPVFAQGQNQGPQLVVDEPTLYQKQRSIEAATLSSYGWVDEKAGVARIPIEEAKKLIVQRGIPARAEGAADASLGTRRGAFLESTGGRVLRPAAAPAGGTPPAQETTPAAQPAAPHKGHGQ
jgi:hypothetical protein